MSGRRTRDGAHAVARDDRVGRRHRSPRSACCWLLVHPLHVPRWVAFWVVQFYCNALTFLLYKYWAFDAAKVGRARTQYAKQLVIFGGSMLLNTAIPSLLTYKLHVEPVFAFMASQIFVYLAGTIRAIATGSFARCAGDGGVLYGFSAGACCGASATPQKLSFFIAGGGDVRSRCDVARRSRKMRP